MKAPLFRSTDVLEFVQTTDQAEQFVVKLQYIISLLYNRTYTVSQILSEVLPYDKRDKLLQLCQRYGINLQDPGSIEQFLMGLKDAVQKCPVLIIRVGFEPSQRSLEIFSRWLGAQGRGMLLDITVDKRIVGGAILGAYGKYKDYSIRNKIFEIAKKVYAESNLV